MAHITLWDIVIRVLVAFGAGFLVGWEREVHGRPAGLRTNIMACVAGAVAMLISLVLCEAAANTLTGSLRADPGRLGAGILAGMGFLGGGTILRHENFIRGVTTAASLWFVTILGLAFGAGLFVLGGVGVAVALLTLLVLTRFEKNLGSDWYATLTVQATLDALANDELRSRIEACGAVVQNLKLNYDFQKRLRTVTCDLKFTRPSRFDMAEKILAALANTPGIQQVSWA